MVMGMIMVWYGMVWYDGWLVRYGMVGQVWYGGLVGQVWSGMVGIILHTTPVGCQSVFRICVLTGETILNTTPVGQSVFRGG